jgi:hypothetical protein
MLNFRDSNTNMNRTRDVATGSTVSREGQCLVAVMEGGVEKVKPCAGTGSEVVVGFSMLDNETFLTDAVVESVTIPASSPYTIQLAHGNIAGTGPSSYEVRVQPAVGSDYTQNTSLASTRFYVSDATAGVLTFHSANAGVALTIYYRYSLMVLQAVQLHPGVRSPNNTASAVFQNCTVMSGHGQIYTKEYDASVDWSGTPTIKTAADGKLTVGGGGTTITNVRVIKLPTTADSNLGLAINMTI